MPLPNSSDNAYGSAVNRTFSGEGGGFHNRLWWLRLWYQGIGFFLTELNNSGSLPFVGCRVHLSGKLMAGRPPSQMRKPRMLDLFCCAGGAGVGYSRAGFEVARVDVNLLQFDVPQTHYQQC